MSKHRNNASSGMSDLFIDYNCGLTVRRAKSHSKAKDSSHSRDND